MTMGNSDDENGEICLTENSEFGHAQLDFTGSRAEIPLVMTGTVALTVSRPLILASTDKLVRLMVEQGIQCFFYAVAYKIL